MRKKTAIHQASLPGAQSCSHGCVSGLLVRVLPSPASSIGGSPYADPYKKAIAFRGMDGKYREVSLDAPHLEHWMDDLHQGDKVRVSYQEALAIMVEPK
jgi:hypothetical protein